MSKRYQVEVLLRPAVELYAAIAMFSLAMLMWLMPSLLMMPEVVAQGSALLLVVLGMSDVRAGLRILRYRRRMQQIPTYRLGLDRLPAMRDKWFLGRGFRWTPIHTQRMLDTYEERYAAFVQVPDNHDRWYRLRQTARHLPVVRSLIESPRSINPFRAPVNASGNPAIHGVGTHLRNVYIDNRSRDGNMLVLGTTGSGKTRAMEVLVAQDIQHSDRDVVIVIDPKGDGDLLRRIYIEAKRAGREEDVSVFHLGFPDASARYNGVGSFSRITEVATRIANQLPREGNSAAFREFSWRFVNVAARALDTLGRRVSYREIQRSIDDIEPLLIEVVEHTIRARPELKALMQKTRASTRDVTREHNGRSLSGYQAYVFAREYASVIDDDLLNDLSAVYKYDKTYYDKLVSSVGPLLEKLTSGKTGELLSPDYLDLEDERDLLDWRDVIRCRGVVYVGLDALTDSTVSAAVGQTMLADLTAVAGSIYKHGVLPDFDVASPRILLHFDEVSELMGDQFVPMVNKCRGAGMQVTAYTQTLQDIEASVGTAAKAEQIIGNFNHLLMMRVRNRETADVLTEQTPMVSVQKIMAVTGANDGDYVGGTVFTSRNEDRISTEQVRMLDASMLMQLPNGHAFALIEGGRLYKMVFPMPLVSRLDPAVPDDVAGMVATMNERGRNEHWTGSDRWWTEAAHGE